MQSNDNFNDMVNGTCLVNENGKIIDYNADLYAFLGYRKNDLFDVNLQDIINKDDFNVSNFIKSAKNREKVSLSFSNIRIKFKSGQEKYANFKISDFSRFYAKKIYCITFLRCVRNALEASGHKLDFLCQYRHTINNMDNPFVHQKMIVDSDNKPYDSIILDVNKAFLNLYSLKREDVVGKRSLEIFKDYRDETLKLINDCGSIAITGESIKFEYYSKILNKWFLIYAYSPELYYFSAIINDITYLKQYSKALREMQLQQKAILDNIPDFAWLKDPESKFIAVNQAFTEKCGKPIDKIVGKTDFDFFPHELAQLYVKDDKEVMISGKTKSVEEPFVDIKGKKTYIETIKTPIYNDNGEVIGTAGIAHDITERREMELALRESEARYRGLFDSMSSGVFVLESIKNGTGFLIKDINRAALKIQNIEKYEILGKDLKEHFKEAIFEEFYCFLTQVCKTGEPVFIKESSYEIKSELRWFETYIYRISSGEICVLYNDITERKNTEKIKENFVATLTHDLRVPLIAENQTLRYMMKGTFGELKDSQMVAAENMLNSNTDLLNLVNTLLDVFKYESGKIELMKEEIDLNGLVKECLQEMESYICSNKKTVRSYLDEDLGTINIDEKLIKRVLQNLISNGINYTPEGSIIEINAERHLNHIVVSVKDNGLGIPENEMCRLFDRYYSSSKKFRKVGTGLGLYLCKQIIDAHEGKIWVESEPDHGSTFYFELPI